MTPCLVSELAVKQFTLYKVKVSFNKLNPPFWCLLLVGFTTDDSTPAGYSKLVGTDLDEVDTFHGIMCHEIVEVCDIEFDDLPEDDSYDF